MRLLHTAAKTRASFDDPNLVSHAGLVPAVRLAENVGLEDLVAEHVCVAAKVGVNPEVKIGLVGMVQSAALDYAQHNIRINTLIPGTTNTELVRRAGGAMSLPDAAWEAMAANWAKTNVPGLKRIATADEIAMFALALASDDFPVPDRRPDGDRQREDRTRVGTAAQARPPWTRSPSRAHPLQRIVVELNAKAPSPGPHRWG